MRYRGTASTLQRFVTTNRYDDFVNAHNEAPGTHNACASTHNGFAKQDILEVNPSHVKNLAIGFPFRVLRVFRGFSRLRNLG